MILRVVCILAYGYRHKLFDLTIKTLRRFFSILDFCSSFKFEAEYRWKMLIFHTHIRMSEIYGSKSHIK